MQKEKNNMADNIFKEAKFGDRFITRNHELAIYAGMDDNDNHVLLLEGIHLFVYDKYGKYMGTELEDADDIVSCLNGGDAYNTSVKNGAMRMLKLIYENADNIIAILGINNITPCDMAEALLEAISEDEDELLELKKTIR